MIRPLRFLLAILLLPSACFAQAQFVPKTLPQLLDVADTVAVTAGGTLYANGTAWTMLPKASNGDFLTLVAGLPAWAALDADLTSLAAAAGTNTIYYRSGAGTWSAVTIGSGLSFGGGSLDAAITGGGVLATGGFTLTVPSTGTAVVSGSSPTFGAVTMTAAAPQLILGVNTTTMGKIKLFGSTSGDVTLTPTAAAGTATVITIPATTGMMALTSDIPHAVTFVVDGAGTALTTGVKMPVKIPWGGTLTGYTMTASPSGSITFNVFRAADTAGLPTASIINNAGGGGGSGTLPAISGNVEGKSTTFTSWGSTTLTAFDNLALNLTTVDGVVTKCTFVLYYK